MKLGFIEERYIQILRFTHVYSIIQTRGFTGDPRNPAEFKKIVKEEITKAATSAGGGAWKDQAFIGSPVNPRV